jgi:hypothetical protein
VLPGRTLRLEPHTVPAVRRLLDAVPTTAESLPLEESDAVALVRHLLREGVLVPVTPSG